ncbi:glycosyltransferase family 4 protein [Devosia sp. UYZn731]|uniref:glycosyltransferase family 4 protein n=1 Tax=Devosia sp. UYZn731 TaxID=3156345 RepID=UPI0033946E4A
MVRALTERGHKVTVLTGKPNYPAGDFFEGYSYLGHDVDCYQNADVLRVPVIPRGKGGGLRLALNYLSFVANARLFGIRRLNGRFDAIFCYAPSPFTVGLTALSVKRHTGAPMLIWVQDLWPESVAAAGGVKANWVLGLLDAMVLHIYRGADRVLIQSPAFRTHVERAGIAADRVVYFPQSVDPLFQPLSPEQSPEQGALMPPGFRVMFAGNVGQAQDFETVLAAAERLRDYPEIKWVVIGYGRRHAFLAEEVKKRGLGDRFALLGQHPESSMPLFFAHADALLVTLRKDPIFAKTIPTKIQSYLASGKPIIAGMDGEGARIVLESGAGFAAPASDPDKLAEAVLTLYGLSEEKRGQMGRNAKAYSVNHFDRDRLVDQLVGEMAALGAAR